MSVEPFNYENPVGIDVTKYFEGKDKKYVLDKVSEISQLSYCSVGFINLNFKYYIYASPLRLGFNSTNNDWVWDISEEYIANWDGMQGILKTCVKTLSEHPKRVKVDFINLPTLSY